MNRTLSTPHDETFKKLLQTFFQEFIALFFPSVAQSIDYSHTRFLMQELLVDIVGQEARQLDLLLETKYKGIDGFILIHFEPMASREATFHERMFIYFSRLFERHRNVHKLLIPIAIFTGKGKRDHPNKLVMSIPDHEILRFQFLKVELANQHWRKFIDSDNPVAAALLAKMRYNKKESREVRAAYLRMLLRLRKKLDQAQLALVMSVADLYFKPDLGQDEQLLRQLREEFPEEGESIMKLMPAWSREGYEKGIIEGKSEGRSEVIRKFLDKGFSAEMIAKTLEVPEEEIRRLSEA